MTAIAAIPKGICNPSDHGVTIAFSWRKSMSDRDGGNSFMWFLAGLGFGALLGVLYAPRSGRETRESLKNSALEGKEYLRNRGREARETVNEWVERGKDEVGRRKEQLGHALDSARQAYREASEGKKG